MTFVLGVQNREIWLKITLLSAELQPSNIAANPQTCQLFCSTALNSSKKTLTEVASSFPRSYNCGHHYACVNHFYACVDHYYARVDHFYACVVLTNAYTPCMRGPCTYVGVYGPVHVGRMLTFWFFHVGKDIS